MRKKILAIDFDGTIVNHEFPYIGTLKPNAFTVINRLFDEGYKIIIWSCRGGEDLIKAYNYCKEVGLKFHKFNENISIEEVGFAPFPKVYADIYIDDRQLGGIPDDWEEIYNLIKKTT